MKYIFLLLLAPICLRAQTPDSLLAQLKSINAGVTAAASGLPVSNRAMNVYLSNKIGYYLSGVHDLTLYKNSVLANATSGTIAINHNLRQPQGLDNLVRAFTSIGAEANATHGSRRKFGFLAGRTWISPAAARYGSPKQKPAMDSIRERVLRIMQREIEAAAPDFDSSMQADFYYEFALRQSTALATTLNYRLLRLHWTSAGIYVPLLNEHFSGKSDAVFRSAYPLAVNLTHTRFWDDTRLGRLYLTVSGDLTLANRYTCSVTPTLHGQFVYFPPTSHFGLSGGIEQNFGPYHATNVYIGAPIVLIDKHAVPACNFEFKVRFWDLGNTLPNHPDKTSVAVTIGIPFSKIAF